MISLRALAGGVALLACLPSMAAQWPPGAKQSFQQSCVSSASEALGGGRAQQYCDCTVTTIERSFSQAQITALEGQDLAPELVSKLREVSQQCLDRLGGQAQR